MSDKLFVSGASGSLGRRVLSHLIDTHHIAPARIVAGTRTPEKLADFAGRGVEVRRTDFEDPASLTASLAGIDRMLLVSTDALDRPGRRIAQQKAAVEAARTAGVRHIVYTSMLDPEKSLVTSIAPDHLETERAIEASGLTWTILRMSWYMEVFFFRLGEGLASTPWHSSAGDGRTAPIAREDCARVAAAALASNDFTNARYDVTGPELLTIDETAAIVSQAFGKTIRVVHLSDEQLADALQARGVPPFVVPFWVSLDANTRAGLAAVDSDAVKKLTGRTPQTLADFFAVYQSARAGAAV
jgi:NAD(P)H dehydrogenase (quinone)